MYYVYVIGHRTRTDTMHALTGGAYSNNYHPAGTTKMGNVRQTELAVVDGWSQLRGPGRIRVCDAGVFPTIPTINTMLTVLGVTGQCAE